MMDWPAFNQQALRLVTDEQIIGDAQSGQIGYGGAAQFGWRRRNVAEAASLDGAHQTSTMAMDSARCFKSIEDSTNGRY
jgi:hypothetical protein